MDNNKINEAALTKRIKTLVLQERFEEALKVLDDIDVSRIRNISILCLVGEVYMGLGRFDEAEHVLLRVYEKQPNTRRILDLLTTLYIDKGEYSEAEYYYKEFIGVASRDLHRYILRYRLDKGKGERLSVLIDTLEKLKDYEYIEEWAYELATLYDASGEKKKCIHECDEIALWFGHGEYVDKAIALKCKLTGEPLPEMTTVEMHQAEEARLAEEERQAAGQTAKTEMASGGEEDALIDDYEDSIDVGLIQRVLDEKSSHNDDVTEASADSSKDDADLLADQIRNDDENLDDASAEDMLAAKELLADVSGDDASDEDEPAEDEAAEDEILPELAEVEEDEADEKSHIASLFSALMFGKSKEKNKDKENDEDEDQDQIYKVIEDMKTETVPEKMAEAVKDDDEVDHEEEDEDEDNDNDELIADNQPDIIGDTDILGQLIGEGAIQIDDTDFVDDDGEEEELDEVIDDDGEEDEVIGGEDDETLNDEDEDDDEDDDEDEIIGDMEASLDMFFENADTGNASDISGGTGDSDVAAALIEDEDDEEDDEDENEDDDEDEISDDIEASDTVLDIFGSVTGVRSIKSQLAKTFTKFEDPTLDSMDLLAPYDINFVVTGYDMSVKSQIAIGIAKALNTYGICDKNKLVRATADDLNGRDFTAIFGKLKGGCLIIEGADRLNEQAAGIIAGFVQQENQDVAIVLEGEEERIKALFKKYPVLHSKFLNIIHIGKYNENELVQLAAGYAKKKGYDLSKPAASVLKRMLRERMRDEYSVNYEDIMAIIEEAIASLEKRNMKNLFMTVLDNKYEEAAMFELLPEDFDNINIPD